MITVRFGGAVGEVTGSAYWVETPRANVLVDFGLFQGGREAEGRNRVLDPVVPGELAAVVLSHAHIDHSGRLPLLAALGARAPVFGTNATLELAEVLLHDCARIAEADTTRANRKLRRAGRREQSPLYTAEDVDRLLGRFKGLPYGELHPIAPGVAVRLHEAGHILGSSSVELVIERPDATPAVLVFSGDLGLRDMPILRDVQPPARADMVFLESTYGDRDRAPRADTLAAFHALLRRAVAQQQRMIVPAFAVGRTQTLLFELAQAFREHIVPSFPIYLDSPMAARAGAIHARHAELFDAEAHLLGHRGQVPETLRIIGSAAESKQLNETSECCMIISAAGMCEGGRVLHHLRHHLWREQTLVLLPGYMAPGTLGRQLADGAREVEVFGEPVAVRAEIVQLDGFSAHADRAGLADWLAPMAAAGCRRIVLTHGEETARAGLAEAIAARYGITAERPGRGDAVSY